MKLGLLTSCLPGRSLEQIATWAADNGFEALEVAAWPDLGDRPFTATHLKVEKFGEADAEATRALFERTGLTLSSLAFYDNNLHPDPTERAAINRHEDPLWGGTEEKIETGLRVAYRTLRPLVVG
jgi:sugar phosphate isomerase/epimerase